MDQETNTHIKKLATSYADAMHQHPISVKVAKSAYSDGYKQAIEDEIDMDDFTRRLSDDYSHLKDLHVKLQQKVKFIGVEGGDILNVDRRRRLYEKLKLEFDDNRTSGGGIVQEDNEGDGQQCIVVDEEREHV